MLGFLITTFGGHNAVPCVGELKGRSVVNSGAKAIAKIISDTFSESRSLCTFWRMRYVIDFYSRRFEGSVPAVQSHAPKPCFVKGYDASKLHSAPTYVVFADRISESPASRMARVEHRKSLPQAVPNSMLLPEKW